MIILNLFFLHIHSSLTRTQYTFLKHISSCYNLTQRIWFCTFLQWHLEHCFMNMRIKRFTHFTKLHSQQQQFPHLLNTLSTQYLLQLLLGHHNTLIQRNKDLPYNTSKLTTLSASSPSTLSFGTLLTARFR